MLPQAPEEWGREESKFSVVFTRPPPTRPTPSSLRGVFCKRNCCKAPWGLLPLLHDRVVALATLIIMAGNSVLAAVAVLFVLLAHANASPYNETEAKRYVDYAGAAYCCGGLGAGVSDWSCKACQSQPGLQNITMLYNSRTNANGYIGHNPQERIIVIGFSGTDPLSIANWVNDISTLKQDYPYCEGCRVHKGFYNTYLSIQGQLQQALVPMLRDYPSHPVQVTGHSMGAAIAVHCALDIFEVFGVRVSPVYTFGQPRVGNDEFQAYYFSKIETAWRITHYKDPVPHLPLQSMGFRHNPTEVFYDRRQKSYKICDGSGEDKSCSDKYLLPLNVVNHLNYLGFDFTTYVLRVSSSSCSSEGSL